MSVPTKEIYRLYQQHPVIVTDSRKIVPGCLFFALKGESFDGNTFAPSATENGAACAIIDNPAYATDRTILVEDVLKTLQELACLHRNTLKIPVIGITGTNGKTTTKELVFHVLKSHYKVHATTGNLNNHIGVPLTLLSAPGDAEFAIIEMGANHPGEIGFLSNIARPTHGLITNIGKAHLEGFGGYEGVIRTKSELYHFLRVNRGVAFVNGNNSLLVELADGLNCVFYGNGATFEIGGSINVSDPLLRIDWMLGGEKITIQTKLVGDYNFENVMAAICIGDYFKVPHERIVQAISSYVPSNNRSQTITTQRNIVIMDAYNANPSSMKAALLNFSNLKTGKKVAILGDMRELGSESEDEHRHIVSLVKGLNVGKTFFVGPEFIKVAGDDLLVFADSSNALEYFRNNPLSGFTILLKGSRGIRMESILDAL